VDRDLNLTSQRRRSYFGGATYWDGERMFISATAASISTRSTVRTAAVEAQNARRLGHPRKDFPGSVVVDHGSFLSTENDPVRAFVYEWR